VIVGFPGETDELFTDTYKFLNELDISYLHVFTYSERANTMATESKDVIPVEVRRKRNRMLHILSEKKLRHFYEQNLGTERTVLFEATHKDGFLYGYTDNYVRVKVEPRKELEHTTVKVLLKSINADGTVSADIIEASVKVPEQVQALSY